MATVSSGIASTFEFENQAADEMTKVDHDRRVEAVKQWRFLRILVAHASEGSR